MTYLPTLLLLAAAVPLLGQAPATADTFAAQQRSEVPLLWAVREGEALLGLPSLAQGPSSGYNAEVRIWDGFGLTGVNLMLARQDLQGHWHLLRAYPIDPDTTGPLTPLPHDPTWADRWSAAKRAGLKRLRSYPRRYDRLLVADGYSVVIEWAEGSDVRVIGANNPQTHCSADDQAFLRALEALFAQPLPCHPRR